ncbi:MAG: hypothetical protein AB1640_20600 [bacterium]
MASWFDIAVRRIGEELNLSLRGEFDGSSASRLIDTLKQNGNGVAVAKVEANELCWVDPAAVDIFQNDLLSLGDICHRLVFYGKHAPELAPAWIDFF